MTNRLQKISVFSLLFIIFLVGCNSAPDRDISPTEILIAESDLPDGWEILSIDPDPILDNIAYNRAIEMIFYYENNPGHLTRGGITIYQNYRENTAVDSYERLDKTFFNEERVSILKPFYVPDGFNFTSSTANQWRFSCHGDSFLAHQDATLCQFLARYEEFVVFTNINIEYDRQDVLSTEELQAFIEAIDRQIATSLEEHPPNR